MTPDALKKKVFEEFDSAGVLDSLDANKSSFVELLRLFEVTHLSMRIVLTEQAAMAVASEIASKIKRDLQQQGVELDYAIAARWKVRVFLLTLWSAAKMDNGCRAKASTWKFNQGMRHVWSWCDCRQTP